MPTLDWIGKDAVVKHHRDVPYRLLQPVNELSHGAPGSGNLIVQGDNLHALKALLPRYAGQVKCIYIDPPYNTGNEGWVYNDNVNSPEIRQWLHDVVGREGEDLSRHDKWLCMMYPRLVLLRQFLREDGAIFVSIDDTEIAHLRLLMDEIFGSRNLLANCIWQKKYTRANDAKYFSDNHDHLLIYARSKPFFKIGRIERSPTQDKAYRNPDNHPLGPWKPTPLHAKSGVDTNSYTFRNGVTWQPPSGTFRRFSDSTMARLDEGNEIWFGKSGSAIPQRKTFLGSLAEGLTPVTLWTHEVAGDNHIGRDEVKGAGVSFDSPKPTTLLRLILQMTGGKDFLVLDSFAGSGTTGHAVLKQNAEDGGNRKFILVEMEEKVAREVTAERVRRVAQGYTNAKGKKVEGLGGGFQYCKLSEEPLFAATGRVREDVAFDKLAEFVWFKETGTAFPIPPSPPLKKGGDKIIHPLKKGGDKIIRPLKEGGVKITPPFPKGVAAAGGGGIPSPLLGIHEGRAVYLLFNGILKDKSVNGGNVLTGPVLDDLPSFDGPKVIYAAACRLGKARLRREGIEFRQTPYALKD